ncbi:MAG: four helix bundle protein [Verrucomicrobiota bacterium]
MKEETAQLDLKVRTKRFAVRILKFANSLPTSLGGTTVAKQIVRSGTSVAANYRAACRARSKKEFLAKLGMAEEECDETLFWIESAVDEGRVSSSKVAALATEASELLAILVSSIKTARRNLP